MKSVIIWLRFYLFLKNHATSDQRDLFLTMFYTINSSPLLYTEYFFLY